MKWRIEKIIFSEDDIVYEIQKRFLGFLWWFNPLNIDAYTTGIYRSYEDALNGYKSFVRKPVIEIIEINQ